MSYRYDGKIIETYEGMAFDSQPYFLTYKNIGGHCQYITEGLYSNCEYSFYTRSKDEAIMAARSITRDLEAMGIKMYNIDEKEIYRYFSGQEKKIKWSQNPITTNTTQ